MADLSHDDVRRAAQEAVGNLQNVLMDLRNQFQAMRNDFNRLNDLHYRISNLEQLLGNLIQSMQRLTVMTQSQSQQNPNGQVIPMLQQANGRMVSVEQRLTNIEQFTADIGQYLQSLHEQVTMQAGSRNKQHERRARW